MSDGWRQSVHWVQLVHLFRPRTAVTQRTHLSQRPERFVWVAMGRRRHAYMNERGGRTKKYHNRLADRDDRLTLPLHESRVLRGEFFIFFLVYSASLTSCGHRRAIGVW